VLAVDTLTLCAAYVSYPDRELGSVLRIENPLYEPVNGPGMCCKGSIRTFTNGALLTLVHSHLLCRLGYLANCRCAMQHL
jgi:hypothetical protein